MRLSLIGMSNIGKSVWARHIGADIGCVPIDCDAIIEKKLEPELAKDGHRGLGGIAKWMGFPSDPQYARNSGLYIDCEKAAMKESLALLGADAAAKAIIDTTGSVIYTGDAILAELRAQTRVIYFEASEDHISRLFRNYIAHPKPVIWGDSYKPQANETTRQTLKRCYPELLRERARRYAEVAHVTIPYARHRDLNADIKGLFH